jgi:hypothetical protein
MEKGYNSDVKIGGDLYHIQTEDWGLDVQVLMTRVFRNGAVLKSYKTSYTDVMASSPASMRRHKLRERLRLQHRQILDLLQSGQIFDKMPKIEG